MLIDTKTSFNRIHLFGYDGNKLKNDIHIIKGKIPETPDELIVTSGALIHIDKNIGDELVMTFEGITKIYKIVGIAEFEGGDHQTGNLFDGKDYVMKAITFLDVKQLRNDTIVDVSMLSKNINRIYETTKKLEQELRIYEIPNINKIEKLDKKTLEEVEMPDWWDIEINSDDPRFNEYYEISDEKVEYNQELLECVGAYEGENEQYQTFIIVRSSNNYYTWSIKYCTNYYFI